MNRLPNVSRAIDRKWIVRHAIARKVPLSVRKWVMNGYHWFFLQWGRLTDFVRLSINGRGETPQVYFPYYMTQRHNGWRPYATCPPLRFTSYPLAKLCHWINRVPDPARKPCVVECEHILALAGDITNWQHGLQNLDLVNRRVAQEQCRFVFTYSAGLMMHSRRYLHPELWRKFGYIHPCTPVQPDYPRPPSKPFTIFVIASRFSDKGLPEALQAFRLLHDRYGDNVRMNLVSQAVPDGYPLPEGVTHYNTPRMSDELKTSLFRSAHVLLLPCYSDSGIPIFEAYSFGVPVILTRLHHGTEVVQDSVTGYLIDTPIYSYSEHYGTRWKTWEEFLADLDAMRKRGDLRIVVDQAVDRLEAMISGGVDHEAMGRAGRQFHAEHFSPEAHNRKLLRVYAAALSGATHFPDWGRHVVSR